MAKQRKIHNSVLIATEDSIFREGLAKHLHTKFHDVNLGQGAEFGWVLSVAPLYNVMVTNGILYVYNENNARRALREAYDIIDPNVRTDEIREYTRILKTIEEHRNLLKDFKPRTSSGGLQLYLDNDEILQQIRRFSGLPIIFYGITEKCKRQEKDSVIWVPAGTKGYESLARTIRPYLSSQEKRIN